MLKEKLQELFFLRNAGASLSCGYQPTQTSVAGVCTSLWNQLVRKQHVQKHSSLKSLPTSFKHCSLALLIIIARHGLTGKLKPLYSNVCQTALY